MSGRALTRFSMSFPPVRQATMKLRYNQQIRDQGLKIQVLGVCWDKLPNNFKAAVLKFGSDNAIWDDSEEGVDLATFLQEFLGTVMLQQGLLTTL
jgi:hypothetical protein